jgi:hypothetical protein
MAKITVAGTIGKVSEKGNATLWEDVTTSTGKRFSKPWFIMLGKPGLVHENDWLEIEGDLGSKIDFEYKDKNGNPTIQNNVWQPTIIKHVLATPKVVESTIDEDDQRKYGAPF